MSSLAKVLRRHDGTDYFNAKVLQAAGRYESINSAYHLLHNGNDHYEKLRELLRRLPRAVTHDVLVDLTGELSFTVAPREACDGQPPVKRGVELTRKAATLTHQLLEFLTDNVVSDAEDDVLERLICEIERDASALRQAKNSRRPMRVAR